MSRNVSHVNLVKLTLVFAMLFSFVFMEFFPNERANAIAASTGQEVQAKVITGKLGNELRKQGLEAVESKTLHAISLDDLNLGQSKAYELIESGLYAVQYTVKNSSKFERISHVSIIFSKDKEVLSYEELALTMLDEDTASLKLYQNGNLQVDEVGHKPDVTPQFSATKLSNCLSSAGISWAVAWAIAVTCGVVCLFGPAPCLSCVLVEAAWGGALIARCVTEAFL
ncbi:hypothetical protein RJD24_19675 [Bacillaceae bacterium IKA-2]|nr:hypothetical protein RJD24_19675 [Bacillaceae bacterium IKA-2]